MPILKFLCFLIIFSSIFTNCSTAQEKLSQKPSTSTNELSDKLNPETNRFESQKGNFSIRISKPPFQIRTIDAEKGEEPGKQYLWQFEYTTYSVFYSALDKNDLLNAFDDMNIGVRKAILRNGVQLTSESEISFGKYQGREFRYTAPNGVKQIGRNYLVNNMGYQLTAGYIDEKTEKEAIEVLNSFKLLSEPN